MKVDFGKAIRKSLKFAVTKDKFLPYFLFCLIATLLILYPLMNILKTLPNLLASGEEIETLEASVITSLGINGIILAIFALIIILVALLIQTTYIDNYNKWSKNKKSLFKDSVQVAKSKYISILGASIIILLAGTILGVIPLIGTILSILLSLIVFFVYQDIILKKSGAIKGIKNSYYIFRENILNVVITYLLASLISIFIIGIFALPLLIVFAKMFIPLIGTDVAPETSIEIITNIQTIMFDNQLALGITGLILIIGSVISKLFGIAIKTDVYNQLKKRSSIL